jgi:hypothetical protein
VYLNVKIEFSGVRDGCQFIMAEREQVQFLRLLTRFRWHSRRIRSSDACWARFDSLSWFCENSE